MARKQTPIILALLLLALTGCSRQASSELPKYRIQSGQDLNIFITTDTHYLSKSLWDDGPAFAKHLAKGDGKQLRYSEEMMKAFAYDVALRRPDITIISGDLTNNGEKASHLEMADHLAAMENSTGTQVFVIPGNHDLLNPWACKFKGQHQYFASSIKPKEFTKIYSPFGYDEALSRDSKSLSYLAAPSEKLWLLMLDTSLYRNNKALRHPQLEGELSSSTLKWIDRCGKLAKQNGARILAVMHHSLMDHSKVIQKGFTINNSQEVMDVLQRNGIHTVFSGHIHIQDIGSAGQSPNAVNDIANSALSVYPHQFSIVSYSDTGRAMELNTSRLNMELWAAAKGVRDPNLLHFNTYSGASFGQLSFNRGYRLLSGNSSYSGYTEHQLQAMAYVLRLLTENYFAGRDSTSNGALTSLEGYRLWMNAPPGGLKDYVLQLIARGSKDNHHLHVELP
jgi:3',5'-cyclic AMP phosphodiesterase CpdA